MEVLIAKLGSRLPIILTRAAAGDPVAIAELIALGGAAAAMAISNSGKE